MLTAPNLMTSYVGRAAYAVGMDPHTKSLQLLLSHTCRCWYLLWVLLLLPKCGDVFLLILVAKSDTITYYATRYFNISNISKQL